MKTTILSLGGSLIVPDNIDTSFLKSFKNIIEKYIRKNFRFVIYAGGGKIARRYQEAAAEISQLNDEDLDWLGIHATRINAHLLKTIFKGQAEDAVIKNPNGKINFRKGIVIGAGWKPGWSTDYDAVLVGKNLGIKEIVNMSNIDYVYDKDPKKNKNARPFTNLSWGEYRNLIEEKWSAGLNSPFDPIAAEEAQKNKMMVAVLGNDLGNFQNYLDGRKFKGTIIE